jgi:DEAD/DEAH box helicase domain-containing protein
VSRPPARGAPAAGATTALEGFLQGLARRGQTRGHLVHIQEIPARTARFADLAPPLPEPLRQALQQVGIDRLYTHQVDAVSLARAGRDVLVVTGTASGKSLAYQLPVLEHLLRHPEGRALFLFPTKALEQDQLKSLRQLLPCGSSIRAEILDGDTPANRRAQLKADPPQILISNPDLLHLSLLPHHGAWKPFWEQLRFVVLD